MSATYSAAQFAELLGVSTWAVYESVKRDECPIRPISLGRRLVWPKTPVHRMLGIDEARATTPGPLATSVLTSTVSSSSSSTEGGRHG